MARKFITIPKSIGRYDTPYTENIYDEKEDIYNNLREEKWIDEYNQSEKNILWNDFSSGRELDISGAEEDDELGSTAVEDVENNDYSIKEDDLGNFGEDPA